MITDKQRIAFFKLVNAAWAVSGFGGDKEAWRKKEMSDAVGLDSIKLVRGQDTYEALMRHFAILAQDSGAAVRYADAAERRHRFVLQALGADLRFLLGTEHSDAYMLGIYRQAGFDGHLAVDDIPAQHLRLIVQIADTYVRKLRVKGGLRPVDLPSAREPWNIRGRRRDREPSRPDAPTSRRPMEAMPTP